MLNTGHYCAHMLRCCRTHQLGVVWKTTVFAGVIVGRQVIGGGVGVRVAALSVASLPAVLHFVVLVTVVFKLALLFLTGLFFTVAVFIVVRAFLFASASGAGPANLSSFSPLKKPLIQLLSSVPTATQCTSG